MSVGEATCPLTADAMVADITSYTKRTLAVWGIVSLAVLTGIVFILYAMFQVIAIWDSDNRAYKIKISGRNNVLDPADDNYDPYPSTGYVAPSGRNIMHRLKTLKNRQSEIVTNSVLDSSKDNYEKPVMPDDDYDDIEPVKKKVDEKCDS
jgi:hypothetical protein